MGKKNKKKNIQPISKTPTEQPSETPVIDNNIVEEYLSTE